MQALKNAICCWLGETFRKQCKCLTKGKARGIYLTQSFPNLNFWKAQMLLASIEKIKKIYTLAGR